MTPHSGPKGHIRARAASFVADWRNEAGEEKQQAQTFIRGLLRVFGISERTAALYEKRAKRASTGQTGFIDALVSGTAVFEMKSAGKDLEKAERQALDYIESLTESEKPHTVICRQRWEPRQASRIPRDTRRLTAAWGRSMML